MNEDIIFNIKNCNTSENSKFKIHMIGIGGVSMSAIALVLKRAGYTVTGSDRNDSDMIEILRDNDIPVFIGANAELVKGVDAVVYTSAINQHDVEFVRAKSLGIPTYERAVFLGMLLKSYDRTICICGTHGKTTTTSMTASIFMDAGLSPNVQVGGKFKKLNDLNYLIGSSDIFILESCEYVDSFLNFPHQTATVLNIDEDHLDYFADLKDIQKSFKQFILMVPENGNVIMNYDDRASMEVLDMVKDELKARNVNIYTFSLSETNADIYAQNVRTNVKGFYSFDIVNPKTNKIYNFYLTVPGIHNVYDALAAITTSYAYGIDFEVMQKSLNEFCGAKRRFELKNTFENNILVYDDYAHHPTEIKATLTAAKQKVQASSGRVIAIFQPHTYTRTKELLDDFSTSFSNADIAIIVDIYAAREKDEGIVNSKMLVDKIKEHNVECIYIPNLKDVPSYIKEIAKPNDIILTIGAGDVTKLSTMINL